MKQRNFIIASIIVISLVFIYLPLEFSNLSEVDNGNERAIRIRIDDECLEIKTTGLEATIDRTERKKSLFIDVASIIKNAYKFYGLSITRLRIAGTSIIENQTISTSIIVQDGPGSRIKNNTFEDITNTTYNAAISLINSPSSIIENNTITDLVSTGDSASAIHLIGSGGTRIDKNIIRNVTSTSTSIFSPRDASAMIINSSQNVEILANNIADITTNSGIARGIYVISSNGIHCNDTIINNLNSRSSNGIHVESSSSVMIKNNTIISLISSASQSLGVTLISSLNSVITNNNITNINSTSLVGGIHLQSSSNSELKNNTIDSLYTTSAFFDLSGINLITSGGTDVEWNNLSNFNSILSETNGIIIDWSDGLTVKNNSLTNLVSGQKSSRGIFLNSSENIAVSGNTIDLITSSSSSAYGIYLTESNSSIISWNILSNIDEWIYIDETSSSTSYILNKIDGLTMTLLNFDLPADLTFEEGSSDNNVTWIASDPQADKYEIYLDGVNITNGTWNDGVAIVYNVDNLTVGFYIIDIILMETTGQIITDKVLISVLENELPVIEIPPADVKYVVGALNKYISWNVTDENPSVYSIYRNDSITIDSAIWMSNTTIDVSVSGLSLGTYNYTIVAVDTSGNAVKDTVFVFVLEPSFIYIDTPMPSFKEHEYGSTGVILNWTVNSIENGTYTIYKDGGTIATGVFVPGTPIVYLIDDIAVGSYNFSIKVIDDTGNSISNYVIIKVVANPVISEFTSSSVVTTPIYTSPPYLTVPPGDPLPGLITTAIIISAISSGSVWYMRRRMVPEVIKSSNKVLKEARKINDKGSEGEQLSKIANTYFRRNEFNKAVRYHKQALSIFEEIGDKSAQQQELGSLGDTYFEMSKALKEEEASKVDRHLQQRVLGSIRTSIERITKD
ncbi:MAG: right-handed parallel beta-helix repeat-containing protein [Candidatus Hodarchaeales archaeon]|jgi:hypothetical protein